jgi:hypothetical protein
MGQGGAVDDVDRRSVVVARIGTTDEPDAETLAGRVSSAGIEAGRRSRPRQLLELDRVRKFVHERAVRRRWSTGRSPADS